MIKLFYSSVSGYLLKIHVEIEIWTCFNRMLNLCFSSHCHHVGPLSAHYAIYSSIVLSIHSSCVQWYHVKTLFKVRLTQPHWFSHHLEQNEALMKVTVFLPCIQYFVAIPWVSVPYKYGPTRSSTQRCYVIYLYVAHYTVNSSPPSTTYIHLWTWSALVQVMACRLFDTKSLPEPMLTSSQLDLGNTLQIWNSNRNTKLFMHENAVETVVCEMAAILSRWRWVKHVPFLFSLTIDKSV